MRVFTVQDTLIASSSSKPMMRSVVTQEKEPGWHRKNLRNSLLIPSEPLAAQAVSQSCDTDVIHTFTGN